MVFEQLLNNLSDIIVSGLISIISSSKYLINFLMLFEQVLYIISVMKSATEWFQLPSGSEIL